MIPQAIKLEYYSDDRGYLVPISNNLEKIVGKKVKRTYVVGNYGKGVIRGFHFHKKEIKIFCIAQGAAKFIALNPSKPENDRYIYTISSRCPQAVIIPPGYANGWVSLEDNTILVALSTSTFKESVKDDMRYDPYKWGDVWSVKAR
jgi:dTDP-4-dehydrorhamnose 3,5-epimerase-like enzyme